MRNRRLVIHCILLCLPVALLTAASIWLLVDQVPAVSKNQRRAVTEEYRETAEELLKDAADLGKQINFINYRPKGWRQVGKIRREPPLEPALWGYVATNDATIVWIQIGGQAPSAKRGAGRGQAPNDEEKNAGEVKILAKYREKVEEGNLEWLLGAGILFADVLCLGLTAFCLTFLFRHDKARDDFLAAAAHDLTTPLVGMRGLIGRDDEYVRCLCARLLRIVDNIRDFLQIGGRRPPVLTEFPIVRAYDEAYGIFAADYADALGEEGVPVSGDGTLRVRADETFTVQILWNLLGNDLKYAAPHGPVRVSFAADGPFVRVTFRDEGPGMTAHQRRRAFDRYYRARTILRSGKGGFGIGLCTAREFARAMGGDLTVGENHPRGCVFTLTLPRA